MAIPERMVLAFEGVVVVAVDVVRDAAGAATQTLSVRAHNTVKVSARLLLRFDSLGQTQSTVHANMNCSQQSSSIASPALS